VENLLRISGEYFWRVFLDFLKPPSTPGLLKEKISSLDAFASIFNFFAVQAQTK